MAETLLEVRKLNKAFGMVVTQRIWISPFSAGSLHPSSAPTARESPP